MVDPSPYVSLPSGTDDTRRGEGYMKAGETRGVYNVVIMGVGFFILFAAFNTAQNYVTSLLPDKLGNESLAILYVTVALSVIFAPAVVEQLGERATMLIGGTGYVVYLVSLIYVVRGVVYGAAVVIGIGAAILWVAQGSFLTKCSPPNKRGTLSGLFWGIFQLGYIVGNLMAYFVFKDLSTRSLFIVFASVAGAGTVVLFALRPLLVDFGALDRDPGAVSVPSSASHLQQPEKPTVADSVKRLALSVIRLVYNKYVVLLIASFFYTGFTLSFFSGEFPQLVHKDQIGVVFISLGVGEVLGGSVFGKISDKIGRSFTLSLGAVIYGGALAVTTVLRARGESANIILGAPWSAHVAALLFGLSDSLTNTQIYAQIGSLFGDSSIEVFTIFQFFQNVGSAIGFYYAPSLPLHGADSNLAQIYINGGLAFTQALLFTVCDLITTELRQSRQVNAPVEQRDDIPRY